MAASPASGTAPGTGNVTPNAQVVRTTLSLSEGVAALELPDSLSPESLEDLRDWIEGMIRRAERAVKRTQQASWTPHNPPQAAFSNSNQPGRAGIPFTMTQAMKDRLRSAGLSDEQIHGMTPAEAHDLLAALDAI